MIKTKQAIIQRKLPYHPSPMDLGFIVLGFDGDSSKISITLKTIRKHYEDAKTLVVVPENVHTDYLQAKRGGTSITSLINAGMKSPPAEWNVVVFAGVQIKERLNDRYSTFLENRYDIFFPLIWGRANFIDAPLNGLTVHRETYKEIGQMSDNNPLDICKMMWFMDASEKGCRFKAIAGTRMA